jgi:hypothetical protein
VTFLTSFHKVTTVSLGTVELAKLTRRRNQSTMAASFMKIHSIKVPMLLQALKKLVWTRAKDDSLSLSPYHGGKNRRQKSMWQSSTSHKLLFFLS